MISILKLTWRFAPHLLTGLGAIMLIAGISTIAGPKPPAAPMPMTLQQVSTTSPEALPQWVELKDGHIDWSEAQLLYKENQKSDTRRYEKAIAPVTGPGGLKGHTGTLLLAAIPWDDVVAQFPRIAAVVSGQEEPGTLGGGAGLVTPYSVSFTPEKADIAFSFGRSAEALGSFQQMGFRSIAALRPGSRPMTRGDGAGMMVTGVVFGGLAVWWLRRRRAARTEQLTAAALSGMRQGVQQATAGTISMNLGPS